MTSYIFFFLPNSNKFCFVWEFFRCLVVVVLGCWLLLFFGSCVVVVLFVCYCLCFVLFC